MSVPVMDRCFAVDGAYWLTVLADATIKATILLCIVVLLTIALGRASAATRHFAWRLTFVGLLALPVLILTLPSWQRPSRSHCVSAGDADQGAATAEAPHRGEGGHAGQRSAGDLPLASEPTGNAEPRQSQRLAAGNDGARETAPGPSTSGRAPAASKPRHSEATGGAREKDRATAGVLSIPFVSPRAVLLAWAAAAFAVLAPLATGIARTWTLLPRTRPLRDHDWRELLQRLSRQLNVRRRVALREIDAPLVPITWGVIRPVILLPSAARAWPPDRRRVVLLHELAHVKRLDVLTQMASRVACALYWFHPLAWVAWRRLRIEREAACDDLVLSRGTKASDYSRHLVELARSLRPLRVCPAGGLGMARRTGLENRLRRILEPGRGRRPLSWVVAAAAAVVSACLVVSLATAGKVVVIKASDASEVARIAVPKDGSVRVVDEPATEDDWRVLPRLRLVPLDFDHDGDLDLTTVEYPLSYWGNVGNVQMPRWPEQAGLIPRPRKLPGAPRWQLETVAPRGTISSICWSPDSSQIAFVDACSVRVYEVPSFRLVRILTGHAVNRFWHATALAWSPDGHWLATGGYDGTVRLWKTDGTPGPVMEGHDSPVVSVRWSPDGRRLASAGYYGGVCVWNADGTLHKRLPTSNWLASLSWSPDGQQLAVADLLYNVQLWNAEGSHVRNLRHNIEKVRTVAWSPDGKRIASGGSGNPVYLWSPDGTGAQVLEGHSSYVHSVAWSPDGKHLASASSDQTVRLWDEDGRPGPVLKGHQAFVGSAAWSPDGSWIATGDGFGSLRLWKVDGTPGPVLHGHGTDVSSLVWSPDGKRVALAGADALGDGFVRLWTEDGTLGPVFRGHADRVASIAWSPDGRQLASASGGEPGRVWKIDGSPGPILEGDPSFVVWSPDGRLLAGGNETVGLSWHAEDGTPATLFDDEDQEKITAIAWSPDGRLIATANDKAEVRLRTMDGEDEALLEGSLVEVDQLIWSPDGALLASASSNHRVGRVESVRLWKSDGTAGPELEGPSCHVNTVTWRPDGQQLAISSANDNAIWLWNTDGSSACTMAGWGIGLFGLSWSPDGQRLASAAGDSSIWIWNSDGNRERALLGHHNGVWHVAWNPRSNQIVSAGYCARTLRSWDADTGEPQWVSVLLRNHRAVTFSADGRLLSGDPETVQREFVYVVQTESGPSELVEPSKLQERLEGETFGFFLGLTR